MENEFVTIESAPLFEINKLGEVRYKKTGTIRKHQLNEDGYPFVQCALSNGKYKKVFIHRALAVAFIEKEDPSYNIVMHLDDDTSNYSLDNLVWGDQKMNMQQSSNTGHYSTVKKEVTLLSPTGEVVHVRGLRTFAAEHNLNWPNFQKMCKETVIFREGRKPAKVKSVNGWTLHK